MLGAGTLSRIFRLGKNDIVTEGSESAVRVLVVDDHLASAEGLRDELIEWQHDARCAGSVEQALAEIEQWRPEVVVCDLFMPPGPGGLEMLRHVRTTDPWIGFIMLTGHGSIDTAVRAIREGAFDFLTKPVDLERLKLLIERVAERNEMRSEVGRLRRRLAGRDEPDSFIARGSEMRRLYELMERIAPSNASVFITGESGVGKDFVAQTFHELSGRSGSPFV